MFNFQRRISLKIDYLLGAGVGGRAVEGLLNEINAMWVINIIKLATV